MNGWVWVIHDSWTGVDMREGNFVVKIALTGEISENFTEQTLAC